MSRHQPGIKQRQQIPGLTGTFRLQPAGCHGLRFAQQYRADVMAAQDIASDAQQSLGRRVAQGDDTGLIQYQ